MKAKASPQAIRATYRLQFNEQFRLVDAIALVPYLHALGLSHLYASPLFKAVPHSQHGYDVCDYSRLNPEIGTDADFERLIHTLRAHGMGLVLDIVPNHMGIARRENHWWWDVLRLGPESCYAHYFDIDWESPDPRLRGKVLLPVLGDYLPRLLARGEIQLTLEEDEVCVQYGEQRFPLNPKTAYEWFAENSQKGMATAIARLNQEPTALDQILQAQHYRLTHWRHGDSELNYRRFFSITSLAGFCVEQEEALADSHELLRTWLQRGWIDGLRVDHPDGLRYPAQYLQRLRALAPDQWLVVEKILEPGEDLPDWPVNGTTGYDFIREMNRLFVDPAGESALTRFYRQLTQQTINYSAAVHGRKIQALRSLFSAEIERLLRLLRPLAAARWQSRDLSVTELREALEELAASFPVYRTYLHSTGEQPNQTPTEADQRFLAQAFANARRQRPDLAGEAFDLLNALLLLKITGVAAHDFVVRFQQLTVAIMAKGVEDTLFYSFNRFIALNEVGDDPGQFGADLEEFHQQCASRLEHWPDSMLATSTHDTKRSGDVRMRLSAISEIPELWSQTVQRWMQMNHRHATDLWPDRNAEYHFYQILVGAWPLSVERATAYMEKATREAKQYTNWKAPNEEYHAAMEHFIAGVLGDPAFVQEVETFTERIATAGHINSLGQTLLKMTLPGVPDFYQGTELWDFSLVDPDNRRPVDFKRRQEALEGISSLEAAHAWAPAHRDTAKMWLIQRVLKKRTRRPELFSSSASYEPLAARGRYARHVLAFCRGGGAITVVPRHNLQRGENWGNTTLALPEGIWTNQMDQRELQATVPLAELFQAFPVALLLRNP